MTITDPSATDSSDLRTTFLESAAVDDEPRLLDFLASNARTAGQDIALSWSHAGQTHHLTWADYHQATLEAAAGLLDLGVAVGDRIGILAGNRPEHLIADHAIRHCGAIPVSLYVTMSDEQAQHILSDCAPSVVLLEGQDVLRRFSRLPWFTQAQPTTIALDQVDGHPLTWETLMETGRTSLPTARAELAERAARVTLDDPATLIYTSGTTGPSKGTIVTHRNVLWNVEALVRSGLADYPFRAVSYLPLAHITERVWSLYLAAKVGGHVFCCPDPTRLVPTLQAFRPTWFMGVPRIWEKLATGARMFMDRAAGTELADQYARDQEILLDVWRRQGAGDPVSSEMSQAAASARVGSLRSVRAFLGLERAYASSGAAALTPETTEFFASIGTRLVQGYGLTETSGPVITEIASSAPALGSVGVPLPGCQIRIADDGEIMIKSPGNVPGYWNLPEKTAELYDDAGWMHSGDIGRIDEAGRLFITDRKKDILVTTAGKNVSPQTIENLLVGRSFIGQVVAIGDAKPYIVALIAPDEDLLRHFAASLRLGDLTTSELVEHPDVLQEVQREINRANNRLSRPEQIKVWHLLPFALSAEDGLLTPTFKLKRKAVAERFADDIASMYTTNGPR